MVLVDANLLVYAHAAQTSVTANLAPDAHLAALAVEHSLTRAGRLVPAGRADRLRERTLLPAQHVLEKGGHLRQRGGVVRWAVDVAVPAALSRDQVRVGPARGGRRGGMATSSRETAAPAARRID